VVVTLVVSRRESRDQRPARNRLVNRSWLSATSKRSRHGFGGPIIDPEHFRVNSAETIERVPIHTDADGVVRVAGTRVTLDTIVGAFEAGATAEEIAQQYPTVPLVDVYSVITYYLRHKPEVDAYLKEREVLADRVREEVERRFPSTGIRERLLARRK
jgi:uncharacterized protein (DUF433 family)